MPFPLDLSNIFPTKPGEEIVRQLPLLQGTFTVIVRMERDAEYLVRIQDESGAIVNQTQRPVTKAVAEVWYHDSLESLRRTQR